MKILILSLSLLSQLAVAKPAVHFVCMASGYGGQGGGAHVIWARGRTKDEASKNAFHECARDTGGACSVSNCHPEYDTSTTEFELQSYSF